MSYILDAVRKADQERRENLAPAIHSLGSPSQSRMPAKPRVNLQWPAIVAGVLLVNVAGWYWSSSARSTTELNGTVSDVLPVQKTVQALDDAHDEVGSEHQLSAREELSKVALWQSPVDAQNAIRSLEFSFHVYADDVAKRTIIINGQRVAEKDRISQDLLLNDITANGVVLLYKDNLLIEVDILEQW